MNRKGLVSDVRVMAALMAGLMLLALVPTAAAPAASAASAASAADTRADSEILTAAGDGTLTLDATRGFTASDKALAAVGTFSDEEHQTAALELQENASVSWQFESPLSGEYTLTLVYMPLPGSSNDIEVAVSVNGDGGSQALTGAVLKRVWQNDGAPVTDSRGNQIRPRQTEAAVFTSATLRSALSASDNRYTLKAQHHLPDGEPGASGAACAGADTG